MLIEYGTVRGLGDLGIDWNEEEKEKILRIIEANGDLVNLPKRGSKKGKNVWNIIDWNDKKDRIFEIAKKTNSISILPIVGIDWSDKEEELIDWVANNSVNTTLYEQNLIFNPIYNEVLLQDIESNIVPFITESKSTSTGDKKTLLLHIIQRLETIGGNISFGIDDANEKFKKNGVNFRINSVEDVIQRINSLDINEKDCEITQLLLFYVNKITKLHVESIYARALGDFKINVKYEEDIDKAPESYKKARNRAFQKGNDIVESCIKLKEKYIHHSKKTFSDFLNDEWILSQDTKGTLVIPSYIDNESKKYYNDFNQTILDLTKNGYDLEEIQEIFLYTAINLEFIDKAYDLKTNLAKQLIEYANERKCIIAQGEAPAYDNLEYTHAMYVYSDMLIEPISIHRKECDVKGISQVNSNIERYCRNNGKNIAYPIKENERQNIRIPWLINKYAKDNRGVFGKKMFKSFVSHGKNDLNTREKFNQFIKEVFAELNLPFERKQDFITEENIGVLNNYSIDKRNTNQKRVLAGIAENMIRMYVDNTRPLSELKEKILKGKEELLKSIPLSRETKKASVDEYIQFLYENLYSYGIEHGDKFFEDTKKLTTDKESTKDEVDTTTKFDSFVKDGITITDISKGKDAIDKALSIKKHSFEDTQHK